MKAYDKIQAIQGLLNDFKERFYFTAQRPQEERWRDEDIHEQAEKTINNIKEVMEK